MIKNYSIISGATFRKRIPRSDIDEFKTLMGDGSFWVGSKCKMTVTATDDYIELLIQTTSYLTKGDYEYKVTALNEFADTVVLAYGRIRVMG